MEAKWNKLSEKLPKINRIVHILGDDFGGLRRAKLKIYVKNDKTNPVGNLPPEYIEEGDIFWTSASNDLKKINWTTTETYPYWIESKDLIKIITNEDKKDNSNRFDLLDIRENK